MARQKIPIREKDLQGLKYFKLLGPLLNPLHDCGTKRDRAGNRRLFYDQYACLLLLFFFSPIVKSLRGIQSASELDKTQRRFGCNRVSRGSLSEASRVFDPELLHNVIGKLAAQNLPLVHGKEAEALRGLTAVDGSLLPALPKMVWALWCDKKHRAAKMHVHFDVLKQVPVDVSITAANDSERDQFRAKLDSGGFYVFDRGYRDWDLFQEICHANASFIGRVQSNTVIHVHEERELTAAGRAAGVLRDVVVKKAGHQGQKKLRYALRIVVIDSGKRLQNGKSDVVILCTNRLDLPAELVGLAYQFRWAIELFFRWLKSILGCRHLLANSRNGVTIQIYLAMIASLLISLWTGRKPGIRTLEMIQFYFADWATAEELTAHLDQLKAKAQ